MSRDFLDPESIARQRALMDRYRAVSEELRQREIPTAEDLWYFEEWEDVGDWLRRHGWDVSVASARELMARNNRSPADNLEDAAPRSLFVSARRPH